MPYKDPEKKREAARRYRERHPEQILAWRENNKEKIKVDGKSYYAKNREEKIAYQKAYYREHQEEAAAWRQRRYRENKEDILARNTQYYQEHKEEIFKQRCEYRKNRRATDENYRLACNLRRRLGLAIHNNQKTGSAVRDLGCHIGALKNWLECQFTGGMSWDNYGEWHIDHVKPLASFDLTDREQLKAACHWSNLQPLWAPDNLSKGAST